MPQLYENPLNFLKQLSKQVEEGWAVIEFDYLKERVTLKNRDGDLRKAVLRGGRVEWEELTPREAERIRGTDRFFIL